MAVSKVETGPRQQDVAARITDEGIERYRARVNVAVPEPPPFNLEAHFDTIRHFAHAYGDDNPLYCDPEYAATSRWTSLLAPPFYLMTMGESTASEVPADVRERSKGALAGVHMFHAGSEWHF